VVGDLVLRLKQDGHGKLDSPWIGPYIVTEIIQEELIDYKTRKQGKMKATHGMQNNYGSSTLRRSMATGTFE
jgi:hypothetical protein